MTNQDILTPGTIIEIADMTELAPLEDVIAQQTDPSYSREIWVARTPVRELLRPKVNKRTFNGRIHDIEVTVMEAAYDRLLDARERGFFIPKVGFVERTSELGIKSRDQFIGLSLRAVLSSTGRGSIGEMDAELWYAPPRKSVGKKAGTEVHQYKVLKNGEKVRYTYVLGKDNIQEKGTNEGKAIQRFVTSPRYNKEPLERADKQARRIGLEVLRKALLNPISTPMGD